MVDRGLLSVRAVRLIVVCGAAVFSDDRDDPCMLFAVLFGFSKTCYFDDFLPLPSFLLNV